MVVFVTDLGHGMELNLSVHIYFLKGSFWVRYILSPSTKVINRTLQPKKAACTPLRLHTAVPCVTSGKHSSRTRRDLDFPIDGLRLSLIHI